MPEHILPLPPRWEKDVECGWVTFRNGKDAIRGFVAGAGSEDKIQFSIQDFADFAAIQAASSAYFDGTLIVSGSNSVYLIGVDSSTLHANDFLLA